MFTIFEFSVRGFVFQFLTLVILTLFYFYLQRTRHFNYWMIRKVPCIKPIFPFGSVKDLIIAKSYIGKCYDTMYNQFSSGRYFGIIDVQHPVLVLTDPDLIKAVLIKDFNHFATRTNLQIDRNEYILRHCINMQGEEWREMRSLLSPAFISGKIKNQYELMEKCSSCLKEQIHTLTENDSQIEITDLLARFTMDMIVSTAFGFETNSINNSNCQFFQIMKPMLKTSRSRFLKRVLIRLIPSLMRIISIKLIPSEVTSLLTMTVRETVKFREKNCIRRSDFLDSLINVKKCVTSVTKKAQIGRSQEVANAELSIEQMTAQAFTFFIAAFSTNTSNLTFCLYELSHNQDIQERLLKDISLALDKHGGSGRMSYEAIQDMSYLDKVIYETLRLYGSGQTLTRICTKQYTIPNSDVTLEKGIRVLIPIYSLHHDPKYFPNPYSFQPERFNSENMKKMHPCVYLPFGAGPRNCIARNTGLLQIKLGIATVIYNFHITSSLDQETPIEIDRRSIVLTPAHPVFLRLTKRERKQNCI